MQKLTAEEMAELPTHMRRTEVCEGRMLPYRLTVALDGDTIVRETVAAAGARQDRPLYVYHDLPVPPGQRRLSIAFVREDVAAGADVSPDSAQSAAASPARLTLEGAVDLRAGEVLLVTYDPDQRKLVTRGPVRFQETAIAPISLSGER